MTIEDKLDLLLLDSIIRTYEEYVVAGNAKVKEAYENLYDMKKMYAEYQRLSAIFVEPYVRESGSTE